MYSNKYFLFIILVAPIVGGTRFWLYQHLAPSYHGATKNWDTQILVEKPYIKSQVCLTEDGEVRTDLSKSIMLRIHSKSKLMQFCALESAVSLFDWPFTGSVPIRAFALGTNFWNFFVPSYPLMPASFACAFSDGYLFYSHQYRIVVPIFKITCNVLSKVKFIYL